MNVSFVLHGNVGIKSTEMKNLSTMRYIAVSILKKRNTLVI